MFNNYFMLKKPCNEQILSYTPESIERIKIKQKIKELKCKQIEIPLIIGGKEVKTGNLGQCIIPHNKGHVLATYHKAGKKEAQMAIEASLKARKQWESMNWRNRVSIFLKAAELLSGPWRDTLNAATMLGQSKTVFQAEIDSACELIDFLRFNAYFISEIYKDQPEYINDYIDAVEYRGLEGFVFAVTPFNFTSIGGNLGIAPAMAGNTVIWKPSRAAVYSNYFVMKLLQEAGLPDGVINFIPGESGDISETILENEWLAGIHFTGSTKVFQHLWKTVGQNIEKYRNYPRLVGETGGKDFIFAHNSADIDALVTAMIRGAFEFQGQKCSAASRAYIPRSIWDKVKQGLIEEMSTIKMGDVEDFTNFVSAVIDQNSFNKIKNYIEFAKNSNEAEIICGGKCDDSVGYFIEPTVIVTKNPRFKTMEEEIFGPVITIYVYEDNDFEETLELCDKTSPYGLTGGIFARDREVIIQMEKKLRYAAGNFYINDKPTGAVVGQQPFGGARASGTNDKAGSKLNLMRWMSPMLIKETFVPSKTYKYPFMNEN